MRGGRAPVHPPTGLIYAAGNGRSRKPAREAVARFAKRRRGGQTAGLYFDSYFDDGRLARLANAIRRRFGAGAVACPCSLARCCAGFAAGELRRSQLPDHFEQSEQSRQPSQICGRCERRSRYRERHKRLRPLALLQSGALARALRIGRALRSPRFLPAGARLFRVGPADARHHPGDGGAGATVHRHSRPETIARPLHRLRADRTSLSDQCDARSWSTAGPGVRPQLQQRVHSPSGLELVWIVRAELQPRFRHAGWRTLSRLR